ncbi:MAG: CoA ester lyase [Burkholderiaceae bacterium]
MSATRIEHRPPRLQRSELAVPATSERFFEKARASVADAVFFDLEDAVADPLKDEARAKAIRAINGIEWGSKLVSVRINGLDTRWALRDLIDVVTHCPRLDMILLPKTGSAFDVRFVEQVLTLLERELGRSRPVGIEVLIETALGVANAEEIAASSTRLEAMIFGVGDYTVDMRTGDTAFGVPNPAYAVLTNADGQSPRVRHWNDQWHFAMARIANACRANGLRAIDGPFTDFGDPDGYRASARRSAALGFEGKWAIHPVQIESANAVYSPAAPQLDWARRIASAIETSTRNGHGAFAVDGVLIDLAHAKLARAMLERQALIERQSAA